MGGLVCAVHRRKNKGFPTLKRTLNLGIEKGRLLKNSRPKGGLIQVVCYPTSPETVDITGFFEKLCIAIRTKKKGTPLACLPFWFSPPRERLHSSVIEMLGVNELPLRRGFCLRRKRSYGAKAPPHGVGTGFGRYLFCKQGNSLQAVISLR